MERKSTLKLEVLKKYLNKVFIETGTYDASGTLVAVEAGFPFIITMEICPRLFQFSCERLKPTKNVMMLLGDSAVLLPPVLQGVEHRCTFWLDAHQPQDGTPHQGDWENCPLRQELDTIASHPIKNHTILIDDVDYMGTGHLDNLTLDMVKERILAINPGYQFKLEDGNGPGTVLAAFVP